MTATKSIRSRLIQVVLTLVIPGWIGMLLLTVVFYRQEREHVLQSTLQISRALMTAVDRDLSRAIMATQIIATSHLLASGDLAAFHRKITNMLPMTFASNLVLTDVSGQQLINTIRPYGEPLPIDGNLPVQREVIETGKPVIGNVFIEPVLKRPLAGIEVPVFIDGKIKYTLGAGFFPELLNELLLRQHLPPNWIAVILDKSGVITARTLSPEKFVGQKRTPAMATAMAAASDGVIEVRTREGVPAYTAYSRSSISGWTVVISIPVVEMPSASSMYIFTGIGSLIILLIGLGFASYQSTQIAGEIRGLMAPALAVGLGKAPEVRTFGIKEANEVAQALYRTSELLQSRTNERDEALRGEIESQIAGKIKDEFVATVSHELRTPLTSIAGALGLLSGDKAVALPAGGQRLVSIAYENVQRLLRLVDDMLDVAKFESGDMSFNFVEVDVLTVVQRTIDSNCGFADKFGVSIDLGPDSSSCMVRADVDRLEQVLTNLLSNAIKFSPADTLVLVNIERLKQSARITVRDHGPGIPEDFKAHVFKKFAQAQTGSVRTKKGTGLGLSIVETIIAAHDGLVGFEDAPNGGTIFYVELPLWEDAIAEAPRVKYRQFG
jgi:signal transduction histidine kinase